MLLFIGLVVVQIQLCFAQPELVLPTSSVNVGESFCVDVRVNRFTDIIQLQFSLVWDTSVLELEGVANFGLPEFDLSNIDQSAVNTGRVGVDWRSGFCRAPEPVALPDGALLFQLCFRAVGSSGDRTAIRLDETPTPFNVVQATTCPTNIGLTVEPGLIVLGFRPIEIIPSNEFGKPGEQICVDFSALGFEELSKLQFSIRYDSNLLLFEEVVFFDAIPGLVDTNFQVPGKTLPPGLVTFNWDQLALGNPGLSLPDSSVLFKLCFTIKNPCATETTIQTVSAPLAAFGVNRNLLNVQLPIVGPAGRVTSSCLNNDLLVFPVCGPPVNIGEVTCIPIRVSGFDSITRLELPITWDQEVFEFQSILNLNGALPGLDQTDFRLENAPNGSLLLVWETDTGQPVSLPDNSDLFSLCLLAKVPIGNTILEIPASLAKVGVNNQSVEPFRSGNCQIELNEPIALILQADQAEGRPGEVVCFEYRVSNFDQIREIRFSLAWDPAGLDFERFNSITLPEADLGNFDLTRTAEGILEFNWNPSQAYSLPDGTVAFTLCFSSFDRPGACFAPIIDQTQTPRVVSQKNGGQTLGVFLDGGTYCILEDNGFNLSLPIVEGVRGDTVCVPVRVADFEEIQGAAFTLTWNPSVISYVETQPNDTLGLDNILVETGNAAIGLLGFSWQSPGPISLPDEEVLFDLCFVFTGQPEECTNLNVDATRPALAQTAGGEGNILFSTGEFCSIGELVIDRVQIYASSCSAVPDGRIELTVSGGKEPLVFQWATSPPQFGPVAMQLPEGEVSVRIFDSSNPQLGLTETFVVSATEFAPEVDIGLDFVLPCDQDEVLIEPDVLTESALFFSWSTQDGLIFSPPDQRDARLGQPGTYIIRAENQFSGCAVTDTLVLLEPDIPLVDAGGPLAQLTCTDSVLMLGSAIDSGPNLVYRWRAFEGGRIEGDSLARVIQIRMPGRYEVEVLNTENNCTESDEVLVAVDQEKPIILADAETLTCLRDSVILLATLGGVDKARFITQWVAPDGRLLSDIDSSGSALARVPGVYRVTATFLRNGCSDTFAIEVLEDRAVPPVDLGNEAVLNCLPDSGFQVLVGGELREDQFQLRWSGADLEGIIRDSLDFRIYEPGIFFLEATNTQNGCVGVDSIVVALSGELPEAWAGADQEICSAEVDVFASGVTGDVIGRWTGPAGVLIETPDLSSTMVENLQVGPNVLVWSLSASGCTNYSIDTTIITRVGPPQAIPDGVSVPLGLDQIQIPVLNNDVLVGDAWEVNLVGEVPTGAIEWLPTGVLDWSWRPGIFGTYQVSYSVCHILCTDFCDTTSVLLLIPEDPDQEEMRPPNAITPNGDGVNDQLVFEAIANAPQQYPNAELTVFNRWGQIIYENPSYQNDWMGTTANGADLPAGTYYFILRLSLATGEILKGDLTIIR